MQKHLVSNLPQAECVQPFCGSLAEFIHPYTVDNHFCVDFIWLDYCGSVKCIHEDIQLLKKITTDKSIIAITVFRGRDSIINEEGRAMVIDGWIAESFPLHKRIKTWLYHEEGGNMGTYVFKVPSNYFKLAYIN